MQTYLIGSNINYFINESIKKITKNIENIITFNLDENTMDEVLEEASYFSMFNDLKCIIVKNANFFGSTKKGETNNNKSNSEKLLKYIANENKNTILIFICNDQVDTKKKIYTILNDANNVYISKKMTKTDIKNELANIVKTNGYQIEDKSLWYIINNSLNNLDIALNELKKIMLYYNKKTFITYDDVCKITSKSIEENNFKIVDSIIAKNLEEALKNLEELKIFKVEPNNILNLIYREFKLMLSYILYNEKKVNQTTIASNLKLAPWQMEKLINNVHNYSKEEIKKEIIYISELDYKLKSGLINKDVLLINYIFHFC